MSDEPSVVEESSARGAALRTALLVGAIGSLVLGGWAATRPGDEPLPPVIQAVTPEPAPAEAEADPATSVLKVRPVAGTPYTVLFSGIGPEDAEDGPSLFTAPRVVGVHNVVLLNTDTGASRRLLVDDTRLVLNARLLAEPGTGGEEGTPRWVALDVADEDGQPTDLTISRLDGAAPTLTIPGLQRVVRVWARSDGTLGALVNTGGALAYRLIDGETLTVATGSVVPLGGGPPPAE